MSHLIDGKIISTQIKDELRVEVQKLKTEGLSICLAVIQVGNNPASTVYVRNKRRACEYIGIESLTYELPETTSQTELLSLINELNENDNVHGILVQLPLPDHIVPEDIINAINPEKDVDGFHPVNVGKLFIGTLGFKPCTPAGIVELIKRSDIDISGKNCVIIGRSNIVGKPMIHLMLQENATVSVVHSKTKDIKAITSQADILIVAIGKARYITEEYIKEGAVIIDVGINRDEDNVMCGDVDFNNVKDKASAITPVPGGVGPMTIAMLMKNCVIAAKNRRM